MFLCRCANRKCRRRRALRHKPEWYKRPPKCYGCGGRKWYWDKWQERKNRRFVCNCAGYWFRHRLGSKFCEYAISTVTLQEAAARWGGKPEDYILAELTDSRIGKGDYPTWLES